ncbi:LysR family transcriptional regulator [Marinomonas epiphytica]
MIPVFNNLQTFVIAAKEGSFAAAASILGVTPAAVSQQIRQLEIQLEAVLFERSKAGVSLTPEGKQYLYYVDQAFDLLNQGKRALDSAKNKHVFTIVAPPSIASKWLMPRIYSAMEYHPEIEIHVEASHSKVNFSHGQQDAAITYGLSGAQNDESMYLFRDVVGVYASPDLLEKIEGTCSNDDLALLPKLDVNWGQDNLNLPSWSDWLLKAEVVEGKQEQMLQYNLSSLAIDAAIDSRGLLLCQNLLVSEELTIGKLVQVSDVVIPLKEAYFLTYPKKTLQRENAKDVIGLIASPTRSLQK